jgi:hypothetical protein
MDSLMETREDWRRCKWNEADCIRQLNEDKRISMNILLSYSAATWIKEWTLYGKIHIHKVITGRLDKLPFDWTDWYKNSWDLYLHTDPECVRVKKMWDLYIGEN